MKKNFFLFALLITISSCNYFDDKELLDKFYSSLPDLETNIQRKIVNEYVKNNEYFVSGESFFINFENDGYNINGIYEFEPNFKPNMLGNHSFVCHNDYVYMNVIENQTYETIEDTINWLYKFDLNWNLITKIKVDKFCDLISTHDALYLYNNKTLTELNCTTLEILDFKMSTNFNINSSSINPQQVLEDYTISYYFDNCTYIILHDFLYKYENKSIKLCSDKTVIYLSNISEESFEFYTLEEFSEFENGQGTHYYYYVKKISEKDEELLQIIDSKKDLLNKFEIDTTFRIKDKIIIDFRRCKYIFAYCITSDKLYKISKRKNKCHLEKISSSSFMCFQGINPHELITIK